MDDVFSLTLVFPVDAFHKYSWFSPWSLDLLVQSYMCLEPVVLDVRQQLTSELAMSSDPFDGPLFQSRDPWTLQIMPPTSMHFDLRPARRACQFCAVSRSFIASHGHLVI